MEQVDVAIVGAGLGGLCAAIKSKESGLTNIVVLEKNSGPGGVWFENRYPGCACDVPIALYQFSFAPGHHWSHLYPRSSEIQAYAEELVTRYELSDDMRYNDAVVSASWSDAGHWLVTAGFRRAIPSTLSRVRSRATQPPVHADDQRP